jgi:large subunit ribosomal protein L14
MIQATTLLYVVDNTGVKTAFTIKVMGTTVARLGSLLVLSVRKTFVTRKVNKGDVVMGVVTTLRKPSKRRSGNVVTGDFNSAVLIKKTELEPLGNRVFWPVANELRVLGFSKIVALARNTI